VDGDKEAAEPSIVLLRKGTQYVQMDLGSPAEIFAIVLGMRMLSRRFITTSLSRRPTTLSSKRTLRHLQQRPGQHLWPRGRHRPEYFETRYGKRIDAKGVKARYLRFYSKGSTESALNEYTEVEVYGGRPNESLGNAAHSWRWG